MRLILREVTGKDIDLLFRWANDPVTRQNAFHTEPIPYETHRAWFVRMLADRDIVKYILCSENPTQEIGQIRLAIEEESEITTALISYSVDESKRGMGYGSKMVLMAEEKLREERPEIMYCNGQVK